MTTTAAAAASTKITKTIIIIIIITLTVDWTKIAERPLTFRSRNFTFKF